MSLMLTVICEKYQTLMCKNYGNNPNFEGY